MPNRLFGGNGFSKGLTPVARLGPGWAIFAASKTEPYPASVFSLDDCKRTPA